MSATDQSQMPEDGHPGEVRVRAVPDSVPHLRRALTGAARSLGADVAVTKRIGLAVTEAATNSVLHAFDDGEPGTLRAHVSRDDDGMLEVVVADDGRGMALREDSPGLGLGLGLIAELSDELRISTAPGGGTEIHMWFKPPGVPSTPRPAQR